MSAFMISLIFVIKTFSLNSDMMFFSINALVRFVSQTTMIFSKPASMFFFTLSTKSLFPVSTSTAIFPSRTISVLFPFPIDLSPEDILSTIEKRSCFYPELIFFHIWKRYSNGLTIGVPANTRSLNLPTTSRCLL